MKILSVERKGKITVYMYITNNYAKKKTIGMNIMDNDLYIKKFLEARKKKLETSSIDCDYVGFGT